NWAITLATDQVDRLTDIVEERGIYPRKVKSSGRNAPAAVIAGTVEIQPSDLMAGWSWPDGKLAVWTDFEMFGFRKQPRRSGVRSVSERRTFAQSLVPGEHVVHVDHGIARFTGLVRMEVQGI